MKSVGGRTQRNTFFDFQSEGIGGLLAKTSRTHIVAKNKERSACETIEKNMRQGWNILFIVFLEVFARRPLFLSFDNMIKPVPPLGRFGTEKLQLQKFPAKEMGEKERVHKRMCQKLHSVDALVVLGDVVDYREGQKHDIPGQYVLSKITP